MKGVEARWKEDWAKGREGWARRREGWPKRVLRERGFVEKGRAVASLVLRLHVRDRDTKR